MRTLHPHPKEVPSHGGPGPSLVSSKRGRNLPGRRSALVRRGRDELFSAAQHQAVSPAGWAGGAVRREGGGRRGWEPAPCSPRTFSWPSSCRTAAQVRGSMGLGMMWGGAGWGGEAEEAEAGLQSWSGMALLEEEGCMSQVCVRVQKMLACICVWQGSGCECLWHLHTCGRG